MKVYLDLFCRGYFNKAKEMLASSDTSVQFSDTELEISFNKGQIVNFESVFLPFL